MSMSDNSEATRIAAAGRRFVNLFALNDAAKIAACYTDDAEVLIGEHEPDPRPRRDRVGVQVHQPPRTHARIPDRGTRRPGREVGAYVRKLKDGSTFSRGRYIVIWKRVGEEWKIHRDMFASQPRFEPGPREPAPKPPHILYPIPPK